jgi:hypothetical protein
MRWVGERRGSPEMFPGRDCVGCHIDNDGPPLVLGGTVYAFIIADRMRYFELQTGTDCFGLEGVTVMVEDGTGQTVELTTNRAGNFFVEGNPGDFIKPFNVQLRLPDGSAGPLMNTRPMYGGCAYCHDPRNPTPAELDQEYNFEPTDPDHLSGTARIGLRGYRPNGPDTLTVEQELMQLAGRRNRVADLHSPRVPARNAACKLQTVRGAEDEESRCVLRKRRQSACS